MHSAHFNQEWLKKEVPRLISTSQWPPKFPDLNPLDFCTWGILGSKGLAKKYQSVDHLKTALRRQSHFRIACDGFVDRLKAIIRTTDGQFEQIETDSKI